VNYARLATTAALLGIVFASCSTANKRPQAAATSAKGDGKFFTVSAESAAFFHHGPRAGRAPDKTLPKETLVKLIRPSFGYSKVELVASGEQGYVASEEIKPASSNLIVAASAPKTDPLATATAPSPRPAGEQYNLNSSDPRLVPPPEDLPPSELPVSTPGQ
jgi:hypothetical protein